MKQTETRQRLIEGAIHVIAKEGLSKATTKQISAKTSMNEVYIYRCFKDKEDLFAKTFDSLDQELASTLLKHAPVMHVEEMEFEDRCLAFFLPVWKFILSNEERCLAFIRYYYSSYFKEYSIESHTLRYVPIVNNLKDLFRPDADVWMILNYILAVMLDFAVKIFNGSLPDNNATVELVFNFVYKAITQYFRPELIKKTIEE